MTLSFDEKLKAARIGTPIQDHAEGFDNPNRFRLIPANTIEPTPTDWLVERYFERGAIIFMYGDTEAFKTFLCLDIACAVAGGGAWGDDCQVKQGPVAYICGEGERGIGRRLAAWSQQHNQPIPDNLYVSSMSTDLADPVCLNVVISELNKLPSPPHLVLVDTFARNYGGSENENTDIAKFYSAVEINLVKPFACTVLVTHHPGKDSTKGARGGSSIKQNSDAMFNVARKDSGDQMFTILKNEKMKDGPNPPDAMFEAIEYNLDLQDEYGNQSTSLALEYVDALGRKLVEAADRKDAATEAEENRKKLLREILEDNTLIQEDYAARAELPRSTVTRYIKMLRKDRYLKGSSKNLKVTAKGRAWCQEAGFI
jgi:RecA-family ATPase